MRSSRIEDKDAYYLAGFTECDSEVARMTGSKMHYSKEEVDAYFVNCLNDSTRYDFLIFDPQGSLIGESVINEIDEQDVYKRQGMSSEEAQQECGRCLRCDHYGFGVFKGGRTTKW